MDSDNKENQKKKKKNRISHRGDCFEFSFCLRMNENNDVEAVDVKEMLAIFPFARFF